MLPLPQVSQLACVVTSGSADSEQRNQSSR
jgi:hypothetical protein